MLTTPPSHCTGCSACAHACPFDALSMRLDEEGFFYPITDTARCTDCDLCNRVCPTQRKVALHDGVTYAAASSDQNLRKASSSGGIFSVLAKHIFSTGGVVCAVRMEGRKVKHDILQREEELPPYLGSKYVQSDLNDCFPRIKSYLKEKRKVLFVGTPCQVAGLKSYIRKDDENLFLVDVLCHAAPSSLAWEKYLEEQFPDEEILSVNFRAKHHGWSSYGLEIKTNKRIFFEVIWENAFLRSFLAELMNRPSCSICEYCASKRVGDITLGDFWGIGRVNPAYDDKGGCSLVMCNTEKAKQLFDLLRAGLQLAESVDIIHALASNSALTKPQNHHEQRAHFLKTLNSPNASFTRTLLNINNKMEDVAILSANFRRDYGAALGAWAMQSYVFSLGLSNSLIDYRTDKGTSPTPSVYDDFAEQELLLTAPVYSDRELKALNAGYHQFLVGPHSLWDFAHLYEAHYTYFLDFVNDEKKKIAYGVNFERSLVGANPALRYNMEQLSHRFSHVFAGTSASAKTCKNELNCESEQCVDPVFMRDRTRWAELAQKSSRQLASDSTVLVSADNGGGLAARVQQYFPNKELVLAHVHEDRMATVHDWLKSIMDASLVITDSFYGICFAVIFNKPFVCFINIHESITKITSLLADLDQTQRGILEWKDIDSHLLNTSPVLEEAYDSYIQHYRARSADRLHKAFTSQAMASAVSLTSIKKHDSRRRFSRDFLLKKCFYLVQILVKRKKVPHKYLQRYNESKIRLR